jgi:hypothetical protein
MYNPEQKQIIVKNSFGVSYHIFYEAGRGLCVRMLGESGIWSRGYVLSEVSVNDYSVILDKDDIFHFVFQSTDGRILYGHGRHGQIEIQPVLTSKDTTPWMKQVSLIAYGNQILLFYLVRYQKKYLLSMQAVKDQAFLKPAAIDYTDGPGRNYQVLVDPRGKCRLFYTSNDGAVKRLNQRLYNEDTGIFSAPEKLIGSEHEIQLCSAVCMENQVHLLYRISSENLYQVFHSQTDSGSSSECLYKGSSPPGYTGLIYYKGILRFFRVSSDCIYSKTSGDNGESWTDEALYPFGTGTSLTCFTYFTNYVKERELSCNELPGTFSKGYQLAFLHNEASTGFLRDLYPDSPAIHPPGSHEGGRPSAEDKKPARESRNELPDGSALKELQKKVMLLHNLTENMQRDLTKLWLTQKGHEKKLTRLLRLYEQLKADLPFDEESTGEDITNRPNEQRILKEKETGMRKEQSPVVIQADPDEDFYDDEGVVDSEENDWENHDEIPDIAQDDPG